MAQYATGRNTSDSEDLENLCSDECIIERPRSSWSRAHIASAGLGLVALVACGLAVAATVKSETVTARSLLEGPEITDAATDNFIKMWEIEPRRTHAFRQKVSSGLKIISARIERDDPESFRRLNELVLTRQQKDNVVKAVRSISDPRVQQFGYEVSKAVREGKPQGRAGVKRRLLSKFQQRLPELRQLRNEIYAGSRNPVDDGAQLQLDQMRIVQALPVVRLLSNEISETNKGSMITSDDIDTGVENSKTAMEFIASLEEQVRVILDNVDTIGNTFGKDLKIPSTAKSFVGGLDFVTQVLGCVDRAQENVVKEEMCPFKYASAGFDALSCIDNLLGFDNENLGVDNVGGAFGNSAPAPAAPATAPPAQAGTFTWN
jgi:hypothetical protein